MWGLGGVACGDTEASAERATMGSSGADTSSTSLGTVDTAADSSSGGTLPTGSTSSLTEAASSGEAGSSSSSSGGAKTDDSTGAEDVAPVVVDDAFFTRQDEPLRGGSVLANDVDPDGGELVVTQWDAVSSAGGVVSVGDGGSLSYTPPAGFWGEDQLGYTAVDDEGNEASATVRVFVSLRSATGEQIAAGNGGFALYGVESGEWSGTAVGGGGDVTGDGIPDVLVGAPRSGTASRGRVVAVSGEPALTPAVLSADAGVVVSSDVAGQMLGWSVAYAGDVNGDGDGDFVIGTSALAPAAYVVFGGDELVDFNIASLGEGGFEILPGDDVGALGSSVHGAGDVNGDGLADLIVGSPINAGPSGAAYVVFGKADTTAVVVDSLGAQGFTIRNETDMSSNGVGLSVGGGGDFNADGLADVVVGNGPGSRVYVVFGKDAAESVDLGALGDDGVIVEAPSDTSSFGVAVAMAGDVNGDGLADVIAAGDESSEAVVIFGAAGNADVDVDALGARGFVIEAPPSSTISVAGADDINGDGLADVMLGTEYGAFVVYGQAATTTLSLPDGGFDGFWVDTDEGRVTSVAGAGDIDGDGVLDVVFGVGGLSLAAAGALTPSTLSVAPSGGPLYGGGPGSAVGGTFVVYGVRTQ